MVRSAGGHDFASVAAEVMRLDLRGCSLPKYRELHFSLPFGMGDRAALMRQCLSTLANQSLSLAGQGVCSLARSRELIFPRRLGTTAR